MAKVLNLKVIDWLKMIKELPLVQVNPERKAMLAKSKHPPGPK